MRRIVIAFLYGLVFSVLLGTSVAYAGALLSIHVDAGQDNQPTFNLTSHDEVPPLEITITLPGDTLPFHLGPPDGNDGPGAGF